MSTYDTPGSFPRITDEELDRLRRRVGHVITREPEPWCTEATRDNIRHYAHGIGDDNPLWCDPAYARGTRYGDVIAPPSFLFACSRIVSGYVGGLPGIHAMWAGADWTWHRVVARNEPIATESRLADVIERETRFSGRSVQQIYHVDFFGADGGLLAEADSWCFRTERDTARERGTKYAGLTDRPEPRYGESELAEIYRLYENEEVRGATPRTFEEVSVGDRLPTMVKGPMTVTGFIAFAQGWGGLYIRSNKLAWQQIHRHPGLGIPNRFGIPDCPERVHWEDELATAVGTPGAYDYGPERCSWMTHQLTNWMGDDGFLVRSRTEIRRHNPVGDTLFIDGEITRTFVDGGDPCVEIRQEARNQDGELSVRGSAVVRLPSSRARADEGGSSSPSPGRARGRRSASGR
ncbi:MAG: MaoC family dehydratase N-terminal domain-containing protein [Thermoanaerobaculia bacterium]|nr:MaoC family dehydratase N-terminal domain-containing protein [Thermoanaerobaculia bacterium]